MVVCTGCRTNFVLATVAPELKQPPLSSMAAPVEAESRGSATTADSSKFSGVHGLGMHIDGGAHGL